jgi:hypothetical protein
LDYRPRSRLDRTAPQAGALDRTPETPAPTEAEMAKV